MAVSKVVFAGQTLIDLTSDTVTAASLLTGFTAHDKTGAAITGTASSGGGGVTVATMTKTLSRGTSATFTGFAGTPKWIVLLPNANQTLSSSYRYISSWYWNGSTTTAVYSYASGNKSGTNTRLTSGVSTSFSGGTLTLSTTSTNNGQFYAGSYLLIYGY